MKILRWIVFCALISLSAHQALADAVVVDKLVNGQQVSFVLQPSLFGTGPLDDPRVVVHHTNRGTPVAHGVDEDFTFVAANGSGVFDFFNGTRQTFHELTLTFTPGGPPENLLTLFDCEVTSDFNTLPFSNCSFPRMGDLNSTTIVRFSGGPGLTPLSDFSIELTGFQPGTLVTAEASPLVTPEPGSMMLFLTGIGALLAGRRLRQGSV